MAGVGRTPASTASPPALRMPATRALSRSRPEARGSRPTATSGRPDCWRSSAPTAARPSASASSGVSSAFASPRTPSVPKSRGNDVRRVALALGVLGRLAGLLEPVLLALDHARVAGQKAALLQLGAQLHVELNQRAGDSVAQRARLPGHPAAVQAGDDVVALEGVGDPQRLSDHAAVGRVGKVVVEGPAVQLERPGALDQSDPGHGLLAPAGAAGELRRSGQLDPPIPAWRPSPGRGPEA